MELALSLGVNRLQYGSGAVGWNPSFIDTTTWFDAADASTITESSGAVSQWNDKSGNGVTASQATGSKQPETGTRTLNGLNVIDFDRATSDNLDSTTIAMGNTTDAMCFVVGQLDTSTNYEHFFYGTGGSLGIGILIGDWRYYFGGGAGVPATPDVDYVPHVFSTCLSSGTDTEMFLDGSSIHTATVSETVPDTVMTIGSREDLYHTDGFIGEIIIAASCSDSDRQKIEGYLAWKWGLRYNLPDSHPYKYDGTLFGYKNLFSPADLTTAAWYDATDTGTITESSGAVSQWDDKSGNNNHATQGTGSEQPITGTRTINGLNTLDFDGTDDYLNLGAELELLGGMVFVVVEVDTLAGNHQNILGHQSLNLQLGIRQVAGGLRYATTGAYWPNETGSTGTISASTPAIAGFIGDTSLGFSIDGTFEDSGTGNDGSGLTAFNQIAAYSNSDELNGKMGEIVFVEGDTSTATRQKIEGYLAHKWGLTANLDAGHPYKTIPPTV